MHGTARLADSKTGAKNLYLRPGALAVLESLPRDRIAGNPHVLPGNCPGAYFVGIQKPWQRVRALAGLPDHRIHDLRHAFGAGLPSRVGRWRLPQQMMAVPIGGAISKSKSSNAPRRAAAASGGEGV
jgi:hypothetical protein